MSLPALQDAFKGLLITCALGALALGGANAASAQGFDAAAACAGLKGASYAKTDITGAEFAENESVPALPAAGIEAADLPPHCVVHGAIEPRTGADGKPYATKFELRLPAVWNGRFFFQGGGGTDGFVRPAYGANRPGQQTALERGFAVVSTDAGHTASNGRDASFGAEPKARIDWGYNSLDLVTQRAKEIVRDYYGRWPEHSYFMGCSNGGRQGLVFTQRFPNHFDGVVVGAPLIRQSAHQTATPWELQVMTAIAPTNEAGEKILSRAFSDNDLALLMTDIATACDELDGLKDGLQDSAKLCAYDPRRLVCSGEKAADCLSAAQVDALIKIHGGPQTSTGEALYAPFPWDSGEDFRPWRLGSSETATPNSARATNTSIRYVLMTPPEPDLDYLEFDFDKDPQRMRAADIFSAADSTYLDAFRGAGGKLLIYHGMGDSGLSALHTVQYYEALAAAQGGAVATESFARLFLVPGMGHCAGGTGPGSFDALEAITQWVETGKAPDALMATGGTPSRERPLCAYPKAAMYDARSKTFGCK